MGSSLSDRQALGRFLPYWAHSLSLSIVLTVIPLIINSLWLCIYISPKGAWYIKNQKETEKVEEENIKVHGRERSGWLRQLYWWECFVFFKKTQSGLLSTGCFIPFGFFFTSSPPAVSEINCKDRKLCRQQYVLMAKWSHVSWGFQQCFVYIH